MSVSPQNPETEVEVNSTRCITTSYALIATLQAHGDSGDDAHLSTTLGHLCQAGHLRFLGADPDDEQDLVRPVTEGAFGR
jgi:hypothetical protein